MHVVAALLLLLLPPGAPLPLPVAEEPPLLPPGAPLLLVARAGCAAPAAAFSAAQLGRHAAGSARFSQLPTNYRLLGREETCGANWPEAVTRSALGVLGAGGGVAAAGRLGARVCGALGPAARALRRPGGAACGEAGARAAALVQLAARLRWRRALLPPARGECGAALLRAARALAAAGLAVRRAAGPRAPHVIILCDSSSGVAMAPAAMNATHILLLHVADPTETDTSYDVTDGSTTERRAASDEPFVSTPRPVPRVVAGDYLESFRRTFRMRSTRGRNELTAVDSQTERERLLRENASQSLKTNRSTIPRRPDAPGPDTYARFDDFDEALTDRLFILSDEFPETEPAVQSIYDEILEACLLHLEARRTGVEILRNNFILYKSVFIDGSRTWSRVATIVATSRHALGAPEAWSASVRADAAGGGELQWDSAERDDAPDAPGADAPGADAPGADAPGPNAPRAYLPMGDVTSPRVAAALYALCATCAAVAVLAAGALCTRRSSRRRRRRRPRHAPVLAAADFQFPAADRRRVGEGMESMLSWLQQLHDFNEPEPERPDLLKRPLGPSAPSSTCSVTRLAPDRRTRYKGDPVHVKYLPAATLDLRRKTVDILLVMQSLRHENVNPFIGCLAELRPALVFAACARGSLEDVLVADDIRLDWTFRLSLLTDLARGMRHLHQSAVRVHARLSSRNCVVDARWVLRVTDYGLPALAAAQALPYAPRAARELLWTAPELLRAPAAAVPGGTQAGDVFSFGIIMQEVIVRGEPYCMLALTPEELVDKLRRPPPLVRPSVSLGAAPPDAVAVMRQCWSEQPELRPDFARLSELFRQMHRGRKTNIVDSMFEMLEKYSNNLEELIKDRTEQLDMEKKKTEQLLNRMLPPSVAERLLLGLRVEPEEFEEVSIYFSDIVGFTALAARCTPVQVVDLLNDLYSAFDAAIEQYCVYKVETIGDAYMVVGGLPLRCRDHAERVASMALQLLHLAGRFRIPHLPGAPLHLRSGLHSGPVCAGVVGLTMPRYCLFGDTVNTAARMESTGAAWRVQLSGATAARLAAAGGFRLRARGLTPVKGKGAMLTYWLLGKDGFDKPLPTPPPLESEEVLFEADGENDNEPPPDGSAVQRQGSSPSPAGAAAGSGPAWRRSGAASAESSPPARRARYLRSGSAAAESSARALRRQWSLEHGDALALAAAGPEPARAPLGPLALHAAPARAPPPRYRTRRAASTLDVSLR